MDSENFGFVVERYDAQARSNFRWPFETRVYGLRNFRVLLSSYRSRKIAVVIRS